MSELVPNLPLLLHRLDSNSLSYELASVFREVNTIEEARERLSGKLEDLVQQKRTEASSES